MGNNRHTLIDHSMDIDPNEIMKILPIVCGSAKSVKSNGARMVKRISLKIVIHLSSRIIIHLEFFIIFWKNDVPLSYRGSIASSISFVNIWIL